MASNKECLVIVLDVRQSVREEFKQKSIKFIAEILKDKICAAKKDYVSFVLLGTQRTYNDPNNDVSEDSYLNIVQYPQVQVPTWQLLIDFLKFVNEDSCKQGEWLDGLVVAMEILKNSQECFKFQTQRILLFYDFNESVNSYDMFDIITENILKVDIGLIVISPKICYIDNGEEDMPQSLFSDDSKKDKQQIINESYALRLVSACNAKLRNCEEALQTIFSLSNSKPWCWNAKLFIGTKLEISVSGVLVIRDDSNIKMKKCWAEPEDQVCREWKYFIKSEEVQLSPDDMINAYMLGATPIPYDEPLTEREENSEASLKFMGFVQSDTIPQEYFSGKTLYCIVHKKGMTGSAKKMDALVRALLQANMCMLCWKIYSARYNTPKLVVVFPNKLQDDRPATLSMIELSYHGQHHFWDFPALRTQKTECTPQQLQAIDDLIDAMDLMLNPKEAQLPRETYQKDLLPFGTLPHIYEQNMMDVLERKILKTAGEDDEQFLEMLADKNFSEVYWKVPELREQRAKKAAKRVKELFPLEKNDKGLEKAKARAVREGKLKPECSQEDVKSTRLGTSIEEVSLLTPAEDFDELLQLQILPLKDNQTLRDKKFNLYAAQMRTALWSLIFDAAALDAQKINTALRVYRQSCYDFNGMDEYNAWMEELKMKVKLTPKLFDFWRDVIVQEELGLCIVGKPSLDERATLEAFYNISESALSNDSMDDMLKGFK